MRPTAIDLFCGAGGLTQGLRDAGYRVMAGIDSDDLAVETFSLNHRRTRTWTADITTLDPVSVARSAGLDGARLDLLAGCPPCQGFSAMRTRNGGRDVDDPQNDLVLEFIRWTRALKPRGLMVENVPKLRSDRRMDEVRSALEGLGYGIAEDVLDAADYGVPQRRQRYILLALDGGTPAFGARAERRRTVRGAIGWLPAAGTSGDPLHDLPERRSKRVRAVIADVPPDGGSRRSLGRKRQLGCHRRSDGWKDVYGRLAWAQVASTITGGFVNPSKGRFLHPEQNRAITLREGALLQTFPRDYRISLRRGKFPAAQLIGNALPPRFIRRHAEALRLQFPLR